MKYVKPSLHLLNLEEFDYPELIAYKYTEDYGFDRVEYASVFFNKKFAGRMSNHFVFQEHADKVDFLDVQAKIREFNQDLKSNWDEVLLGLLEDQEARIIDQIASLKDSLNSTRKTMKKFRKVS